MPRYEYACQECGALFEIQASMAEYSKGLNIECPKCRSEKAIRVFRSINVLTSSRGGNGPASGCPPSAGPGCCG